MTATAPPELCLRCPMVRSAAGPALPPDCPLGGGTLRFVCSFADGNSSFEGVILIDSLTVFVGLTINLAV